MFKIAETTELGQVSLTGLRALVIIGLLIVMPRTFEEIKSALIKLKLMDETNSDDTLRGDINTIKTIGCDITRPSPKTEGKYILTKHPYSFSVTKDEIDVIRRAYNVMKQSCNIALLIEYDNLFKKIAKYVFEEETREAILGISALRYLDTNMLRDLIIDCKNKRDVIFMYETPTLKKENMKEGIAQKITFQNDKVYLYVQDLNTEKVITYNVRRIKSVLSRRALKGQEVANKFKVSFYLKNSLPEDISEDEYLIEYEEKGYFIEAYYLNEFWAAQRILNFGSQCTVVEPEWFKERLIQKLKGARRIYE